MHSSYPLGEFFNLLAVGLVGINNLAVVLSAEYVLLHLYKKNPSKNHYTGEGLQKCSFTILKVKGRGPVSRTSWILHLNIIRCNSMHLRWVDCIVDEYQSWCTQQFLN